MLRCIIAVCIGLCCIEATGQYWAPYAERMEWRIMHCPDGTCRTAVLVEKLDSAFRSPELVSFADDIFRDINRLNWSRLTEEETHRMAWNASLLAYTTGQFSVARQWWSECTRMDSTAQTAHLFLGFLIELELDSTRAMTHLHPLIAQDSAFVAMEHLLRDRWAVQRTRQGYVWAGALLPGSGLMAEGYIYKGFTALALNSGVAVAIIALLRANLYINMVTWGLTLVQKFYIGQLNLTKDLSKTPHPRRLEKVRAHHQNELQRLLQRYPLDWRQ